MEISCIMFADGIAAGAGEQENWMQSSKIEAVQSVHVSSVVVGSR